MLKKVRWLGVLAVLIFVLGGMAAAPKMKTPGQVLGELEPHYRIFRPKGPGPHPAVMVFHGAADEAWKGPEGNEQFMHIITALRDKGYAVIFVDSYSGRGLSGSQLRSGTLLPAERAADLLVTLDWARKQPWVDRERIAAVGFSHGGTTIMDAFVLAPPKRRPAGLISAPVGGAEGTPRGSALLSLVQRVCCRFPIGESGQGGLGGSGSNARFSCGERRDFRLQIVHENSQAASIEGATGPGPGVS